MFRKRDLFWSSLVLSAASAATLTYGCLVESNRLTLDELDLNLVGWPERLDGFRLAVLSDFHVCGDHSTELAMRSVHLALDQSPDMLAIVGDLVAFWEPRFVQMLGAVLEPIGLLGGNAVAVPGNHDHKSEDLSMLRDMCAICGIKLLQNESWQHAGISWIGIDSFNEDKHRFDNLKSDDLAHQPRVVLWHEPDAVDLLPFNAELMLAGHSHGGQFTFPWGWTPKHSKNGKKYPRGFYPDAPTPLYVSRGVGTTGFPSRLNCPPEVAILTLHPAT